MHAVKLVLGGVVGIIVGTIGGFIALGLQLSREHPGVMIGIDPRGLCSAPIFWIVLLPSIALFTYLFSRIGRNKRPSQL
jgi:hypothetical protein